MIIQSYIKTAVRSLWKDRFYALLNVAGLAVGMASCLLIWIYLQQEHSYDKFHANAERIYRLNMDLKLENREFSDAISNVHLGPTLKDQTALVEDYMRIYQRGEHILYTPEAAAGAAPSFSEKNWLQADPNFFQFFSFELLAGDPATVLEKPRSLVLTEESMYRYFGASASPQEVLGRTLMADTDQEPYKVTGIAANLPVNSHIQFNVLGSLAGESWVETGNWVNNNIYSYLLLSEAGITAEGQAQLKKEMDKMLRTHMAPIIEEFLGKTYDEFLASGQYWTYSAMPMLDIHLKSKMTHELQPSTNERYLQIFSVVAIFILLLACINYMNLATARSANRAREVGVRKVLGAYRRQIMGQFLAESLVNTFIAIVLAFLLAYYALPNLAELAQIRITFPWASPWLWVFTLVLMLIASVLAGGYPAFYLAKFAPVQVLKGKIASGAKNVFLRNVLVVLQFTVSIVLIICSLLVNKQVNHMLNRDAGFERDRLLVISNTAMLDAKGESFKERVKQLSGVESVAYMNAVPSQENLDGTGFGLPGQAPDQVIWVFAGDSDMAETLGLRLKSGRLLSDKIASDTAAVLLNEQASRKVGGLSIVDEVVNLNINTNAQYTVAGVVENFIFRNMRNEVDPVAVVLNPQERNQLVIRANPGDEQLILQQVEELWKENLANVPFEYFFAGDSYGKMFAQEARMGEFMKVATVLAIFIACLGLLGLSAYNLHLRRKEISIRKVLGAPLSHILLVLTRETLSMVLISCLIAVPLAYLFMKRWLNEFVYHIEISLDVFLLAAGIAIIIAMATVSYQTLRAALTNPAPALKENA